MIKRVPIIDVNTGEVIRKWSSGKMQEINGLTQENLEKFFRKREGWNVIRTRKGFTKTHGIFVCARYKNDIEISVMAGEGLYSSPRKKAEKYQTVEVAIFDKNDEWITKRSRHSDSEAPVIGYVGEPELIRIVSEIERMR